MAHDNDTRKRLASIVVLVIIALTIILIVVLSRPIDVIPDENFDIILPPVPPSTPPITPF